MRWTLYVAALALVALAAFGVGGSPAAAYDIDDEALLAEVNGQPLPSAHARTRVETLMAFDDLPPEALALLEETAHDNPIAASLVHKQKDEPTDKKETAEKKDEKSSGDSKKKKSKRGEDKRTEKDDKKDEKKSDDKKSDKKSDDKSSEKKDKKDDKDSKSSSKKDDAKVDEKSSASNSTATASAEKKQANPVAPSAASDNAVLNATGPVKGVDNWTTVMGRGVYSAPTGVVIGTIPAKAELVIEYYAYEPSVKDSSTGRSSDETLWGWGYVTSPEGFGGWAGENACGFFPLQRRSGSDLTGPLTLQATREKNIPNHPTKCPKMDEANKQLQPEKILKQGSYLKSGGLIKAITSKTCQTHTNYDPAMKSAHGPSIPIEAGTYSGGLLPVGTVPTSTPQKKMVENFGLRYVTKDGKMALISYPLLDPAQPGLSDFFVPLDCIEFDAAAITNANKLFVPKAAPSVVAQAKAKAAKAAAQAKAKAEKEKKLKTEEAALLKKRQDRLKKHRKNKNSNKNAKKSRSRRDSKGKSSKRGGKKHGDDADAEESDSKSSHSKKSHSKKSHKADSTETKQSKSSRGKKGQRADENEDEESSSKKKKSHDKDAKKSTKKDGASDDEEQDNKKSGKGGKSKGGKADNDEREEKNERKSSSNRRAQTSFLETEDAAETDAEEESDFADDATLMEVAASTHASLSNDGPRGDYPGWSEMLLEESASAQVDPVAPVAPVAAAPAPVAPAMAAPAAPTPVMQAAPVPAAAAPASTIKLGETQTEAVLKNASIGIKKVNVHVYGQADPAADAEKERRLESMVQRLARNQSESYQKINDLLRKLKACGAENKACIAQLTEKLEDWKQENVAPK